MSLTPPVPLEPLYELDDAELARRTQAARQQLGDHCIILGHHYQREEVYKYADLTGDSLKLSRLASQRKDARYIVFCGVHFMAEVADMLSGPEQITLLPDLAAGCSMADMADLASVERVWRELSTLMPVEEWVTPVTYVNSSAELKAFCGQHGGIVCTSSNAARILDWSFAQRQKVLFFPDQHLGRNCGYNMGIPTGEMVTWDPGLPLGGLTKQQILEARIILWHGYCSVHQMFQPEHVTLFRQRYPGIKVIVHPECSLEVCQLADGQGSTEGIQQAVRESPAGSIWAVGTELNLVNRLKNEMPDKEIHFLCPIICMCSTMFRIDSQHLCWTLENLAAGYVVNPVHVPQEIAIPARIALERMLEII